MVRRKIVMPELPEVETVTKILKPIVIGRTINKIDVLRKQTIIGDAATFVKQLTGEKFVDITRIGKYIIFHLTNDKVIISHLRMEGKFYKYNENEENSYYSRVVFHFDNNEKLCYDDSRCFGILIYSNEKDYRNEKEIAKLGPEPFDVKDVKRMVSICKNKSIPIKAALLDQSIMCGIGNIYADEILFACGIHPLTSAKEIDELGWKNIVKAAQVILNKAIELGGSTIKSYHPGKDIDGKFQNNIQVYGKSGEDCPICGSTLRFIKIGGRGTTFCPKCQLKMGAPLNVAITGKIASGKTLALNEFKKANFAVLQADELVAKLYEREDVSNIIEKSLKIKFKNGLVDKKQLGQHLLLNPQDKRKLERIVHPLVRKQIELFLKTNKSPIRVVEIPLLFESGLDELFDTIIVLNINENQQKNLLFAREKEKALLLSEINKSNKIDQNKGKATYLIDNNSTKENFISEIKNIIRKLKQSLN